MRLIDVTDFSLIEVYDAQANPYAILSHTWGDGEVTFQDMANLETAKERNAWSKVEQTCALARSQNIPFAWIDTCCIDKTSSAELTEAINSMFDWYKKAAICYTYLNDLPEHPSGAPSPADGDLEGCRWFSRGWTLQELIASKAIEFYDESWNNRGTKKSLEGQLCRITGIDRDVLSNSEELPAIPVARKMSWAAGRCTTRVEDVAYSLLGIFGVNMALIYGEGSKAFIRLQEAIAQSTNDLSLFAWVADGPDPPPSSVRDYHGILAGSPQDFAGCGNLRWTSDPRRRSRQSFAVTNKGVEFQTLLRIDREAGDYLMPLYCYIPAWEVQVFAPVVMIAIRLVKTPAGFVRHKADRRSVTHEDTPAVGSDNWDPFTRTVCVPKTVHPAELAPTQSRFQYGFRFRIQAPRGVTWKMTTYNPVLPRPDIDPESLCPSYWDPANLTFLTAGYAPFTGLLFVAFSTLPGQAFAVFCGLSRTVGWSYLTTPERHLPWVAIHIPDNREAQPICIPPPDENWIKAVEWVFSRNRQTSYLDSLDQTGRAARNASETGKSIPTKVALPELRVAEPDDLGDLEMTSPTGNMRSEVKVAVETKETRFGECIYDVQVVLDEQISAGEEPGSVPGRHGPPGL